MNAMATKERSTASETEVIIAAQKPLIISLKHRKHVNWLSNVIDNEGMGKKSSKSIYCLYYYSKNVVYIINHVNSMKVLLLVVLVVLLQMVQILKVKINQQVKANLKFHLHHLQNKVISDVVYFMLFHLSNFKFQYIFIIS